LATQRIHRRYGIRTKEVGPYHIVLSGVSDRFAQALENERDGNAGLRQLALEAANVGDMLNAPENDLAEPPGSAIRPQPPV
jgi:hypothetical protein